MIEEIKKRLDNLRKRGLEGYAAKEDFQANAETDIEYLLSIIEQCENACEGIIETESNIRMKSLAKAVLRAIRGSE